MRESKKLKEKKFFFDILLHATFILRKSGMDMPHVNFTLCINSWMFGVYIKFEILYIPKLILHPSNIQNIVEKTENILRGWNS